MIVVLIIARIFYIHVFITDICTRDLRGPAVIQKLSELSETEQNHV